MASSDRRGFLRGLASLPLIGGSLAIVGSPVRAAVPAGTDDLMRYACFALHECTLVMEHMQSVGAFRREALVEAKERCFPMLPTIDGIALRAPVILSAAGVPLV